MTGLALAVAAAYGVHLLFTGVAFGWRGVGPGPATPSVRRRRRLVRAWLVEAGLGDVRSVEIVTGAAVLVAAGAGVGWMLFGGVVAPMAAALATCTVPVMAARSRRERRRAVARDAWPRLIEEIRVRTSSLGWSIPQAVFDVGRRAPAELRPAFERGRREWLLSTDFERALDVLRAHLVDATADAVCETLLVAHQIGGSEVGRCLGALIEDRVMDLQGRKDAASRQAGARFARSFTLLVPLAMALIGMSIGQGRSAYESGSGQALVLVAIAVMVLCWLWAGRIMRLPGERRVFVGLGEARP